MAQSDCSHFHLCFPELEALEGWIFQIWKLINYFILGLPRSTKLDK